MAIKLSGSTIIDDSRNIVNAGIVTATSFDGDGSGLSGIVTSITAGTGISIDQSTGQVTISATGGGGSYSDTDVDTHLNVSGASANEVLSWSGTDYTWVAQSSGSGSSSFTGLNDTPGSLGTAGQVVVVNSGATALEFVTPYGDTDVSSHLNTGSASANQVLSWNGSDFAWVAQSSGGSGGIALTDLSVGADGTASGSGSLSYNNVSGVFTYTPPDLSSYLTSYTVTASDLSGISIGALSDVDTASPTDGQALLWSDTNSRWEPGTVSSGGGGTTTFLGLTDTPSAFTASKYLAVNSAGDAVEFVDAPSGGGGIALTDLSITTAGTASGGGSLSYDNATGVFTFTPADTSGGGGGSSTFLALTDTPASFGTAGQVLAVNSSADGLEFVTASSGGGGGTSLTVQTRNGSSGAEGNEATAISKITFNSASGFSVSEPNEGEAFISLGSAFAPWSVDGQTTLTPEGEEEVEFIAGDGITITTNNTSSPKSITFTASGGGGGGGGATTLADLTDTNISSPATGAVLKWNGTAWFAGTDNVGSGGGGGGGGGDGSAPLGANSRLDENLQNTYAGGLLGLTNSTQINDAIDQLNQILVKLAPPTPDPLSLKQSQFYIQNSYGAIQAGTNESLSTVVDTGRPQSSTVQDFYDGANGTLTFTIDGVQDGQIALSENVDGSTNVGTDLGLTITSDTDPYAGATTGANFWEQISAKVQASTTHGDLTPGENHTYTMTHSSTGSVSAEFFVDAPNTGASLSVSGESVDTSATNVGYVSGVPTFTANATIAVSCTVNGAVTKAYNSTKVCTITSGVTNPKNVGPDPAGYSEGDAIALSAIPVAIGNYKFSDSDFSLTLKGVNSKGTAGSPTYLSVPGRVDTKSNESLRKTSGSGDYPASGFGDTYDSTQSLASNEELQMRDGKFVYPSTDYSSNALAGPNYSSLSGTRWVTFEVNGPANKGGGSCNITATGLSAASEFSAWQTKDNNGVIKILFRLSDTGDWMSLNDSFSPGPPMANGVGIVKAGDSSHTNKAFSFPAGAYLTSAKGYVKIGLDPGSTATITSVSVSY